MPRFGSLFVLCFEGFTRGLTFLFYPRVRVFGYADDVGALLEDLWFLLGSLVPLFARLELAISLGVNIRKTKLLPLWRSPDLDFFRVKHRLHDAAPVWRNMEAMTEARYLGVSTGPTARGRRWDRAIRTYVDRARLVGALASGNLLAASVLSYPAKF
jgi:hypothetical protein